MAPCYSAESARSTTIDEASVIDDLRKMVGDTRFCDMLFICSDGQEVPALRMLVAARSPVLESLLLTSGMVESRLERVPLAETRGSVMRACVEFLYTGHVQDSTWPKPLDEAMEVAAAARFFLINGLETRCIDHLFLEIHRVDHIMRVEDSSVAGEVAHEIIRAYNLGAVLYLDQPHKELDVLLNKFTKSVQSALNRSFGGYTRLSQCGCLRLLGDLRRLDTLSPELEYHLLVHAIRWCASRLLLAKPNRKEGRLLELLDALFPFSDARLRSMLERRSIYESASEAPVIRKLAGPLAIILNKSCLDLSQVPLTILCTIFEPLKIIPCSKLLAAYRFHALCRPDLRWDDLSLQRNYTVSKFDPTEITCVKSTPFGSAGLVASSMCVRPSINPLISEWEIVILEPCKKFRYGFYFGEERLIATPHNFSCLPPAPGEHIRSVALGSNGTFYQSAGFIPFFMNKRIDGAKGVRLCVRRGTKLGVHIDFGVGRCSFKVDGVIKASDLISSWEGGGVYPAISMEEPGKCRLQMVIQESVLEKDILTATTSAPVLKKDILTATTSAPVLKDILTATTSLDQGQHDSKKRRHE